MTRYRTALAVVAAVIGFAVLLTIVRQPAPASLQSPSNLFPVSDRTPAPEFTGLAGWINSAPLTVAGLRGHVVLVDFWTFSCVNCVRTLPHLKALYSRYHSDGLVIVGMHSPEFDFEKVAANVRDAVSRLAVTWPVALDSQMQTWNAYANNYWPAEYLIDKEGRLAYTHFGEGDYDTTAAAVAQLLGRKAPAAQSVSPPGAAITPELYAGSARGTLADGERFGAQGRPVAYPDHGAPQATDLIQVTGTWADQREYLEATAPGHVRLRFRASEVFVVAGSADSALMVSVQVDGAPPATGAAGPDLSGAELDVTRQDLFHVLTAQAAGYHLIDLSVPAGFRLYTFTFG